MALKNEFSDNTDTRGAAILYTKHIKAWPLVGGSFKNGSIECPSHPKQPSSGHFTENITAYKPYSINVEWERTNAISDAAYYEERKHGK